MPAIGKILIIFASVLILTRIRVPLGIALLLGGLSLNIWAGLGVKATGRHLLQAFCDPALWLLLVITFMIMELGRFMTEERNASEILAAARSWGGRHGRTATAMGMPAAIGLFPMPAGALLSAPFVQKAGESTNVEASWKCAVNYWFRHIWEYWWPLYPGVILAMTIFAMIETWQFIAVEIPFTFVALGAGYFTLVRPKLSGLEEKREPVSVNKRRIAIIFIPMVVVIVSVLAMPEALKVVLPTMDIQIRKLFAMAVGLLIALAIVVWDKRNSGSVGAGMFRTLFSRKPMMILVSLIGVIVFKTMLEKSALLPLASGELKESPIPVAVVVAALPFLAGLVTGIAYGFAGVAFPLVFLLLTTEGSSLTPLATLVLAYGFGYMGMMLSPIHLCLIVTRDYFDASFASVYRRILPSVAAVAAWAVIAHLILLRLGW